MKKLIPVLTLIVASIIVLYGTEYVLKNTMKSCKIGTIGKINSVMNHNMDVEFTIWGASTAYLNFNPQIIIDSLGYSTMNMGIDGTGIDQYNGLLQEYLSYSNKSKYVIIALDVHGGLGSRTSLYHLHNWLHHVNNPNIYNCLSDIDPSLLWKLKYVPFYDLTMYDKHAFPYFRKTILNQNSEFEIDNHGYKSNGFSSIDTNQHQLALDNLTIDKVQINTGVRALNKIRDSSLKAKARKIIPIVVVTPCYEKGMNRLEEASDVLSAINSLKKDGIQVLDLSSCSISRQAKYFRDNTHLNSLGADEFTRIFVQEIKKLEANLN